MPIAALAGSLVRPAQALALLEAITAAGIKEQAARNVLLLVLECAFTDAHLVAHMARKSASEVAHKASQRALDRLDQMLHRPGVAALLGEQGAALYLYRLGRMRNYALGAPSESPHKVVQNAPYVLLSEVLARRGEVSPWFHLIADDAPGTLMLTPQARSAHAKEGQ